MKTDKRTVQTVRLLQGELIVTANSDNAFHRQNYARLSSWYQVLWERVFFNKHQNRYGHEWWLLKGGGTFKSTLLQKFFSSSDSSEDTVINLVDYLPHQEQKRWYKKSLSVTNLFSGRVSNFNNSYQTTFNTFHSKGTTIK